MQDKKKRFIILLCCLCFLTGCARTLIKTARQSQKDPELRATSFTSFDGTELPLRVWPPPGGTTGARCIFIALHGFNDYGNFIRSGAEYFARHRILVYAYDMRGFGNAPGHGRWSSTENMVLDLKILIRLVMEKHPQLPVFLLGHSMGGALVIRAMSGNDHKELSGAILVAPAVWSRSTQPFYQSAALWLVAHAIPWYRVTGEMLDRMPSDNLEMLREQGRDPLVIKQTRFDTIYGLQNLMDEAYEAADSFSLRTILLYGKHDEIIPEEPVMDVYGRFPDEWKELVLYENGYHMLLRDLQAEKVLADIVAWVEKQM